MKVLVLLALVASAVAFRPDNRENRFRTKIINREDIEEVRPEFLNFIKKGGLSRTPPTHQKYLQQLFSGDAREDSDSSESNSNESREFVARKPAFNNKFRPQDLPFRRPQEPSVVRPQVLPFRRPQEAPAVRPQIFNRPQGRPARPQKETVTTQVVEQEPTVTTQIVEAPIATQVEEPTFTTQVMPQEEVQVQILPFVGEAQ